MVQVCVALRRAEARKIVVICGGGCAAGGVGWGRVWLWPSRGAGLGAEGQQECRVGCVPKYG